MGAEVRFEPDWRANLRVPQRELVERVNAAVLADAKRGCPVDTGALVASLTSRVVDHAGGPPSGTVGSELDYAASVEFGSRPHIIRSHGDYPLRNAETGEAFGQVVHHPGTKAQPFLRPALRKSRPLG